VPHICAPTSPRWAGSLRGVIVTAVSAAPEFDFVSASSRRPSVNEDSVTGSAHCCLAPFWAGRRAKTEMVAYQASAAGAWCASACVQGGARAGWVARRHGAGR